MDYKDIYKLAVNTVIEAEKKAQSKADFLQTFSVDLFVAMYRNMESYSRSAFAEAILLDEEDF